MPFVELVQSPLAPGVSPVRIRYRDQGGGTPLVFLHGGWGYALYPIVRPPPARLVIPDRSGYGGSTWIDRLPRDFHARAAGETSALLEALHVERPVLWGHSDGAVIAALMALAAPDRVRAVILEAMHLSGRKPSSQAFFEATANYRGQTPAPIRRSLTPVSDRVAATLALDHGDRWRQVVARHSDAWLQLHRESPPDADFYGGRLRELRVPALVVHGARDPRTEPGELEAIRAQLPNAAWHVLADGAHSPHSERATAREVARLIDAFV